MGLGPTKPSDNSQAVRRIRAPINGGPPEIVLEASAIVDFKCSRAPASICAFIQEKPKEFVFSVFDPAIGKPHEVAKLQELTAGWGLSPDGTSIAAINFGSDDHRIRLTLAVWSAHARTGSEKLERLHVRRLGGRFQRAFCHQQSCGLEAKLAVRRFSGQCTPNLANEQHLA